MVQEKEKMTSFTFYELYYKAIELFDDVKAGKLTMRICNYMLDKECIASRLTNKEEFYWLTIKDMLKEVKEIEIQGKHSKKYNRSISILHF